MIRFVILFEQFDALVKRRIVQGVLQGELRAGYAQHFLGTSEEVHLNASSTGFQPNESRECKKLVCF